MKKLKKYKNVLIGLGIVLAMAGVFFISKLGEDKYFKHITYEAFENLKDKSVLLYVGSKEDKEVTTSVKDFALDHNLRVKYIYNEDLTEKQLEELLGDNDNIFIYAKAGKISKYEEEINETGLTKYLVEKEILSKTYVEINMENYVELLEQKYFAVVIGRTGCHYCDEYKPIMNEVMAKNNIVIYYVDTANLDDEGYGILVASSDYLSQGEWGTPTTLLFEDGKEAGYLSGKVEASQLTSFLKEHKAIK